MTYNRSMAVFALGASMLCASTHSAEEVTDSIESTIDACALLRSDEIAEALGLPADAGMRRDEGLQEDGSYSSTCVWTIRREIEAPADPSAPLGGKSFVILNAMQWPAGSGLARTFLDAFHIAAATGEIGSSPAARAFGDEALWWGDGLAVRKGDVSFGVSVFLPGREAARPAEFEEQLAPHILRRLDRRDTI